MLFVSGVGSREVCRAKAEKALADGSAFEVFERRSKAEGGDVSGLPRGSVSELKWRGDPGYVTKIDTEAAGLACVALGAGRVRKDDVIDLTAGVTFLKKPGEPIVPGDTIALIAKSPYTPAEHLEECEKRLTSAYTSGDKPAPRPTVYGRYGEDEKYREQ